jgi:hypothetical protein
MVRLNRPVINYQLTDPFLLASNFLMEFEARELVFYNSTGSTFGVATAGSRLIFWRDGWHVLHEDLPWVAMNETKLKAMLAWSIDQLFRRLNPIDKPGTPKQIVTESLVANVVFALKAIRFTDEADPVITELPSWCECVGELA